MNKQTYEAPTNAGWEAISSVIQSAAYKWPLRTIINRTPASTHAYRVPRREAAWVSLSCGHQIKNDQRHYAKKRRCPTCAIHLAENPS